MGTEAFSVTTPAPREIWQELFFSDPEAVPYQAVAWCDCIGALEGFEDASRLYEFSGGQRLVMPMVRRKFLPGFFSVQASPPHGWGMGGFLSAGEVRPEEVAAIFADLAGMDAMRASIRPNPRTAALWAAAAPSNVLSIPRVAHVLDLEGGFGKVWTKRFKKRTRSRVRKAERSGIEVECDTSGKLIPDFYDLLLQSFDRWAGQQHEPRLLTHFRGKRRDPVQKFKLIAEKLGDACRVWVARLNGQPVAASIVLQYGNVNDARNVMNKELAAPVFANDLLLSMSIEDACRSGCRYYHLGESGASTGLAHYKERFGARPYPYAEYVLERIPITQVDGWLRGLAKRVIGFKDT